MSNSKGKTSEASKLIKLFVGFSMGSWLGAFISFFVTPIITRLIAPEALGSIDLFVSYCVMFEYASTLGMHQSLMRYYNEAPEGSDGDELLRFSVRVSTVGALIAGFVITCGITYFSNSILGEINFLIPLLMTVFILSNGFIDVVKTRPRMLGQTRKYTTIVICLSVGTKLAYLSYAISHSVLSTVAAIALMDFLVASSLAFMERGSLSGDTKGLSKADRIGIFKYALPTIPVMFMSNVNTSIPKIMLNSIVSKHAIGVYAATSTLVHLISLIQVGVNLFWSPFVFSNYKEKKSQIQRVHLVVCFCMLLGGLLLILCEDLLFLLLGSSYREGASVLGMLAASPVFYTIGETLGIGINIEKKTYWNIVVIGTALVTNLVLCVVLIPLFDLIGAAASVMISAAIMLVLKGSIGERYYTVITSPFKTICGPIIYMTAAVASGALANNLVIKTAVVLSAIISLCFIYRLELTFISNLVVEQLRNTLRSAKGPGEA